MRVMSLMNSEYRLTLSLFLVFPLPCATPGYRQIMMRPLCLWTVAMLAASATAFIPHPAFRPSSPVATRRCSRAVSRGTGVSMMSGRRPFIAGNWKENPDTLEAAIDLAKVVRERDDTLLL